MNLFSWLGNLFGGRKRREEEERVQAGQPVYRNTTISAPPPPRQNPVTQLASIPGREPEEQQMAPFAMPVQLRKAPTPQSETARELDGFYQQAKGGNNGDGQARQWAINQYYKKYGFDKSGDPEVANFQNETNRLIKVDAANREKERADAEKKANRWKTGMEIAGMLPFVAGPPKIGAWVGSKVAGAVGAKDIEESLKNSSRLLSLGMTEDEFQNIDPEKKWKLDLLQGADVLTSPLDFIGAGSLLKAPITAGIKSAAKQGVTNIAKQGLNREAKNLIKQGLGAQTKQFGIGSVVGVGMDAATQQWINGEINPTSFPQSAFIGGGISSLTPGGSPVEYPNEVVPGVLSVNPNRLQKSQVGQPLPNQQPNLNNPLINSQTPVPQGPTVGQAIPGQQPNLNNPNINAQTPVPQGPTVGQPLPGVQSDMNSPLPLPETAPQPSIGELNRIGNADFTNAKMPVGDNAFDADARAIAAGQAADPYDVPTFQRQMAPETLAKLEADADRLETIKFFAERGNPQMLRQLAKQDPELAAMLKTQKEQDFNAQKENLARVAQKQEAEKALEAQKKINEAQSTPEPTTTQKAVAATEQVATDQAAKQAEATANTVTAPVAAPIANAAEVAPEVNTKATGDVSSPTQTAENFAEATGNKLENEPVQSTTPPAGSTAPGEKPRIVVDTAKTGEIGKSTARGARGREYEKTSRAATAERAANEAANNSFETLTKRIDESGEVTGADFDAATAIQTRYKPGSPEHKKLGLDVLGETKTAVAQRMAVLDRENRKIDNANKIVDRYANKLYSRVDDIEKITPETFDDVITKTENYVKAREDKNAALEAFNTDPSDANMEKVVKAFIQENEADKQAKLQEYQTAVDAVGKTKDPKIQAYLDDLKSEADVYMMDAPDASFLSSTRVIINNFLNTLGVRAEETAFGNLGARFGRMMTGENIGGGSLKGAKLGSMLGDQNLLSSMRLRQGSRENRLSKTIKNAVTTGNTLGERNTYATAYSGIYDHYATSLKKQGYTGKDLHRRAVVNSLVDPDGIKEVHMGQALASNALSPTLGSGPSTTRIETAISNYISRKFGGGTVAKFAGKAFTRVLVGFPTVVTRSAEQGVRRSSLGTVSFAQGVMELRGPKADKAKAAMHFKNSVKEAGSGATMFAMGAYLGAQGLIAGRYPTDEDERARWKREGISENSIKIGNDWYSLPAALGAFALPFMIGANAGQNGREGKPLTEDMVLSTVQTLINAMPLDQMNNTMRFLMDVEGGRSVDKFLAQTGSSLVRVVTPLGSLVNQLAKSIDPTANDTTKGDALAQFFAKVQDGIPGPNLGLEAKTVDGKEIKNPGPIARFFGATSTEQSGGVEKTQEIKTRMAEANSAMKEYGVFTDGVRSILDDETAAIFDNAKGGKELDESDMKKLTDGIIKGVEKDADTRFLEDEDYDSNLAVLRTKRDVLAADPTTRQAELDDYDTQIKRGEIYKERQVPYKLIKNYKDIDLTEWKEMGDGDGVDDNPELYQALWDLDVALTEAGVSRRSSDKTKQKYYTSSGSGGGGGRGGSGGSASSRNVGSPQSLGKFSPKGLTKKQSSVAPMPVIKKLSPNDLVKKRKISVSRGR